MVTSSGNTAPGPARRIPFLDLSMQYAEIKDEIDDALGRVLTGGRYILGPEVEAFEREFAEYSGCAHAVGVASGTDAIVLSLKALGIGAGDEVVTTPFTAVPTVTAILLAGAKPVFADIEEGGYGLDPRDTERAVSRCTRAIVPVHIFGECVDIDRFTELSRELGVFLVEDACQAHGATYGGRKAGSFGAFGCFSFYPTKNLGAFGDGGMVTTNDAALADRVRGLRDYGRSGRDLFAEVGVNSRLDELHATALRVKLRHLDEWTARRRRTAAVYNDSLAGAPIELPVERPPRGHVYHLYAVASDSRDDLASALAEAGVQTHVHYPHPLHLQPALARLGYRRGDFPRAEAAADHVLSLPLNPWMTGDDARAVASSVAAFYGG